MESYKDYETIKKDLGWLKYLKVGGLVIIGKSEKGFTRLIEEETKGKLEWVKNLKRMQVFKNSQSTSNGK